MTICGLFCSASSFNQPLNKWNVSNVKDMSYMFYGANIRICELNKILNIRNEQNKILYNYRITFFNCKM